MYGCECGRVDPQLSVGRDSEQTYTPVDLKIVCEVGNWSVKATYKRAKRERRDRAYLVRKGQGKLDLVVHGLSVTSALERSAEGRGTGPEGRASEAERAHLAMDGEETTVMVSLLDLCLSCKGRSRMPVVP